ncbi:MAG TPA: sugar phosphate isomerase/epimerase family protein [Anaerolineaceae bacterium]|nr:sugar phosphate isomerase/epimerase family protein [Anaerolineaceae bacterium]
MKVGIDSYCYHRFFGEVYPDQKPPEKRMTMEDFLRRANELGVDGVSLESCFFPTYDEGWLKELKAQLDDCHFDRVYAWGHPDGLERGQNWDEYNEMIASIPRAKAIGADVMRVVGSSLMFRHEPHGPQIEALTKMFKEAVKVAKDYEVKMAVENHIDFTSDEILQLLESVDSEYLGLNFDTGNFLRLLDDPIKGMEKLAPYVYATHVKDLYPDKNASPTDWFFFAGVPVGKGLINNQRLAELLQKAGFKGFLAVEIDHPHTEWTGREDEAVEISVKELKQIAVNLN